MSRKLPKTCQNLGNNYGVGFRVRLRVFIGFRISSLGLGIGFMVTVLCIGKFSVVFGSFW